MNVSHERRRWYGCPFCPLNSSCKRTVIHHLKKKHNLLTSDVFLDAIQLSITSSGEFLIFYVWCLMIDVETDDNEDCDRYLYWSSKPDSGWCFGTSRSSEAQAFCSQGQYPIIDNVWLFLNTLYWSSCTVHSVLYTLYGTVHSAGRKGLSEVCEPWQEKWKGKVGRNGKVSVSCTAGERTLYGETHAGDLAVMDYEIYYWPMEAGSHIYRRNWNKTWRF